MSKLHLAAVIAVTLGGACSFTATGFGGGGSGSDGGPIDPDAARVDGLVVAIDAAIDAMPDARPDAPPPPPHVDRLAGTTATAAGWNDQASTVVATLTTPVAAGDLIGVFVTWDSHSNKTVSSVTDDQGNTYTIAPGQITNGDDQGLVFAYAVAAATATPKITAHLSGTICCRALAVEILHGANATAPVAGTSNHAANATTATDNVTSGSIAAVPAGAYVLAVTSDTSAASSQAIAAGTGEIILENIGYAAGNHNVLAVEGLALPAGGTAASTFTYGVAGHALSLQIAIQP